jgi:hypothetical protein
MCPVCVASAVVITATSASTGGILAVCIGKVKNFFTASGLNPKQKIREK